MWAKQFPSINFDSWSHCS